MIAAPDVEDCREVGRGISEDRLGLAGLGLEICRPFPWIGYGEGGGDDGHLVEASLPFGFHDHPRDPRIDRKTGHPPPDGSESEGSSFPLLHGA